MKNELKWYKFVLPLIMFILGLTWKGIEDLFSKKEGEEGDG
jgi:hypothetical protein